MLDQNASLFSVKFIIDPGEDLCILRIYPSKKNLKYKVVGRKPSLSWCPNNFKSFLVCSLCKLMLTDLLEL